MDTALGQRAQGMTDERFIQSTEFYSLVIAAFQRAVDANLEHRPHSRDDERLAASTARSTTQPPMRRLQRHRTVGTHIAPLYTVAPARED